MIPGFVIVPFRDRAVPPLFTCPKGHTWEPHQPGAAAAQPVCPVCGAAPSADSLGLPPQAASALARLRDELARAAGPNLAGLIVYGGLARGRYHPGKSDINVVVLLNDLSAATLAAVAPPLRAAWRSVRAVPLFLHPSEVGRAAAVFPTKFLDIKRYHVVLTGQNPFPEVEVSREQIRAGVEQALRNLALRLRRRYVAAANDPGAVRQVLANVARPLAIELGSLLRLAGKAPPEEDRTADVFETAAGEFGFDAEALGRLAALRRQVPQAAADLPGLLTQTLDILTRAADLAGQMKGAPG